MAGCASSTTEFFPVAPSAVGPQFAEQYAKFSQFAAANEVLPVPQFGTHDITFVEDPPQCYMRWIHPVTSEPFDMSVNLQLASNNEDPDMAELRVFWGLTDHLVVGWSTWNARTIDIGTPPVAPVEKAEPVRRPKNVKPEKE